MLFCLLLLRPDEQHVKNHKHQEQRREAHESARGSAAEAGLSICQIDHDSSKGISRIRAAAGTSLIPAPRRRVRRPAARRLSPATYLRELRYATVSSGAGKRPDYATSEGAPQGFHSPCECAADRRAKNGGSHSSRTL